MELTRAEYSQPDPVDNPTSDVRHTLHGAAYSAAAPCPRQLLRGCHSLGSGKGWIRERRVKGLIWCGGSVILLA
jgi:hypothetical protein